MLSRPQGQIIDVKNSAIIELVRELVISNMHTGLEENTCAPTSKCLRRRPQTSIAIALIKINRWAKSEQKLGDNTSKSQKVIIWIIKTTVLSKY